MYRFTPLSALGPDSSRVRVVACKYKYKYTNTQIHKYLILILVRRALYRDNPEGEEGLIVRWLG
jgi:hypothetical protein